MQSNSSLPNFICRADTANRIGYNQWLYFPADATVTKLSAATGCQILICLTGLYHRKSQNATTAITPVSKSRVERYTLSSATGPMCISTASGQSNENSKTGIYRQVLCSGHFRLLCIIFFKPPCNPIVIVGHNHSCCIFFQFLVGICNSITFIGYLKHIYIVFAVAKYN